MTEEKYYTVRSTRAKTMIYSVNVEQDKRKKAENRHVTINCQFPRPNPALMRKGVSYLNTLEIEALRNEESFKVFEESGDFTIHEIKFKDLPDELQKSYDLPLFQKLKSEAAREGEGK